jgi:hypothetical protein
VSFEEAVQQGLADPVNVKAEVQSIASATS